MDIFSYDKELFEGLNKQERHDFIKNTINKIAVILNNPGLVDKKQAPNENQIFHLYSDGTITRQKGSWAYGKRSIFEVRGQCVRPNTYFKFPIESVSNGDTYAIMTEEECRRVRDLMDELLLNV
jgi:hypothetical protein